MITQTCGECGKKFADLRSHLRAHKMTWQEYRDKYNTIPKSLTSFIPKNAEAEKEKMLDNYEYEKAQEKNDFFRRRIK